MRSMSRPAGIAADADATRKIAGPSPSSPSIPVTSTNVIDDDGGDELQHGRVDGHRRGQQQRVPPDVELDHCEGRMIQSAR